MTTEAHGTRRELVVISIYYDEDVLMAGFDPHDQRELGVPDSAPLNVDTAAYQRGLSLNHVENVRKDWDPVAADAPVLSLRSDGSIWIVNGQHVIAAAILQDETEMLAWVYTGLTVPREADLRLKKNFSRGDTALEKFHARLTKEREDPGRATAIVELLRQFDTDVNTSMNAKRGVNCIGTVEELYARDDGAILRRTLRTLTEAYGEAHGDVVKAPVLKGVAWFMTVHFGELRYRQLINALQRDGGIKNLEDNARGFKRAMTGADWINFYRAIVQSYNELSRKVENKLEMKTSRYSVHVPAQAIRAEEASRRVA